MQNTTQTTIPKSIAKTPYSAKHPLNTPYSNLYLSNSEITSLRKNQRHITTSHYRSDNTILSERKQDESTKQDHMLLERNGYSIYLVNSFKQRIKTSTLIKRMYASRGYCTESTSSFSHNPHQFTFEACNEQQQLLGTLTLTIDSNEGLLADQLYKPEIDSFRNKGKYACEVSKLAFNPNSGSKEVFASLFHIAYIYAYFIYGVEDAFIEINPRHALFYKRMLGFHQIGEQRICQRVDAPAVLLHLDLNYMRDQIATLAGLTKCSKKSIYPYFLSQHKEDSIVNRIRQRSIRKLSNDTHPHSALAFLY
jgi:hypothetical protein